MLNRGFTLIELLLVVAIISLLSSVALTSAQEARLVARDAKKVQDAQQVETALALYHQDNDEYPGSEGSYTEGDEDTGDVYNSVMEALVDNDYLGAKPTSDNGSYTYVHRGEGESPLFQVHLESDTNRPEQVNVGRMVRYISCSMADISDLNDSDGKVDGADLGRLMNKMDDDGCSEDNNWCDEADINRSGDVSGSDLGALLQYTGKTCDE